MALQERCYEVHARENRHCNRLKNESRESRSGLAQKKPIAFASQSANQFGKSDSGTTRRTNSGILLGNCQIPKSQRECPRKSDMSLAEFNIGNHIDARHQDAKKTMLPRFFSSWPKFDICATSSDRKNRIFCQCFR